MGVTFGCNVGDRVISGYWIGLGGNGDRSRCNSIFWEDNVQIKLILQFALCCSTTSIDDSFLHDDINVRGVDDGGVDTRALGRVRPAAFGDGGSPWENQLELVVACFRCCGLCP